MIQRIIGFDKFVEYGKQAAESLVEGVPWSFDFMGRPVTHETDDHYLITDKNKTIDFKRGDKIFVHEGGKIEIKRPRDST